MDYVYPLYTIKKQHIMKNTYFSRLDITVIIGLSLFVSVMVFIPLPLKSDQKALIDTIVYINPEKCSYYYDKKFPCPWDTKKPYKVLEEYSYEGEGFLIVLDNGLHRSIDVKYILISYSENE